MAPASIIVRITPALVAGFDTYGFNEDGEFTELDRLNNEDLPPNDFWIGGEIVRKMSAEQKSKLSEAHLFDNPQKMLANISEHFMK